MDTLVRKTPSYLKGLAETRARAAGDIIRFEKLFRDIRAELAEAKATLTACDRLIKKFDIRLDPSQIEPVRASKGRYLKRGGLKRSIAELLKAAAPAELTTTELFWHLTNKFRFEFQTAAEAKAWKENSLLPQLKEYVREGYVERLHNPLVRKHGLGRWLWVGDGCQSLVELAALATMKGVGTTAKFEDLGESAETLLEDALPV